MKKILTALFLFVCITTWAQQPADTTVASKKPVLTFNLASADAKRISPNIDSLNRFFETHTIQLGLGKKNSGTTKGTNGECEIKWQAQRLNFYAAPVKPDTIEKIVERVVTPKDGGETPPIIFQDNRKYYLSTPATPPQIIQQPCCNKDRRGENEFAGYVFLRSVKGNILLSQGVEPGFGLHMITHRLYKNDDGSLFARPMGWKSIAELYLQASKQNSVQPPCDTCGNWTPFVENKDRQPAIALATGPVMLGWKPFKEVGWLSVRASFMFRYDTPLGKNKNAGWSGFSLAPEVELLIGAPTKPHVEISASERWHPFPTAPATFGPGAFNTALNVRGVIPFGQKTSAERQSEKLAKKQKRESLAKIRLEQKMVKDSIELDTLIQLSSPIQIDSLALAPDAKYQDPEPQKIAFVKFKKPLPFSENKRGQKLNKAKVNLLSAQNAYNQSLVSIKNPSKKLKEIKENKAKVKKAERRLKRMQKRANK